LFNEPIIVVSEIYGKKPEEVLLDYATPRNKSLVKDKNYFTSGIFFNFSSQHLRN